MVIASSLRTRHVVAAWLASRLSLVLFVGLSSYLIGFDRAQRWNTFGGWLIGRFAWADSYHYVRIAEKGYLPPGLACCDQAFFPGYPLTIRLVRPLVGGNATLAGLLVAHLAAAAAALLLFRLAQHLTGDSRVAAVSVLLLAVAPYGVFLTAVFTESLFLALALGAWLAGSRGSWWWAGSLAGLATLVRINGLFLGAGLLVMYAVRSRWRLSGVALLLPPVAVFSYFAYLHALTGSWTAWTDAQTLGWDRRNAWPWQGLAAGWRAVRDAASPDLLVAHVADLAVPLFGIALLAALLWLRRWAEATYIGLNVAVLICSTTLQSAPRYALTWFPGYLVAAELVVLLWVRPRRRSVLGCLALLCAALMAAVSLALAAHLWVA